MGKWGKDKITKLRHTDKHYIFSDAQKERGSRVLTGLEIIKRTQREILLAQQPHRSKHGERQLKARGVIHTRRLCKIWLRIQMKSKTEERVSKKRVS